MRTQSSPKHLINNGFKTIFLLTTLLIFVISCSNNPVTITNPPSTERGYLVSYTKAGSITSDEIISINQEEGDISEYAHHDLDFYSIVYNSVDAGNPLEVSGLVFIPQNMTNEVDLIQYHHGTTIPFVEEEHTPSLYTGGESESVEVYFIGATMASNGYVVSLPDYVGYGISADREHPYTVHHELAEVSIDMLRATKQLLAELSISFSNDVFLTGWSEGGGAALATHKYCQEKYSGEFNVKASSLFAGPYDYSGFFKQIISESHANDDAFPIYSWALYSLNKYNPALNRNTNTIWSYPVSDQFDALDAPSGNVSEVFLPSFTDNVLNETDTELISAFEENSLIKGWLPHGHLFFHSGTDDLIVPHDNSTKAHQHFQSINANSTLYEYPNGNHYTPLNDYIGTTLNDFNDL